MTDLCKGKGVHLGVAKESINNDADLKAAAREPTDTDALGDPTLPRRIKNVTPKPKRVTKNATAMTTKQAAKPTTKRAAKPTVKRVSAKSFLAKLKRLGITKSDAARAASVSPSLVTKRSGGGRGHLLAESRWNDVKAKLSAYTKVKSTGARTA